MGVVIAIVYSLVGYHYLKKETLRANKTESLNRAYYVTKEMNGLYDAVANAFFDREKECYEALHEAQEYFKKYGSKASLEVLKQQLEQGRSGAIYDIAVINDHYVIEASTYIKELGLDFANIPAALKVLKEVFNNPAYIDLSVVTHAATYANMKRYIVQRAWDDTYMIQLGLTLDPERFKMNVINALQRQVPNLMNSRVYQISRSPRAPQDVERFFMLEQYTTDKTKKISALRMSDEFDELMSSTMGVSRSFIEREERFAYYEVLFKTNNYLDMYAWQNEQYVHRVVMPLFSNFDNYNDSLTLLVMEFDESAVQHTVQMMNLSVGILWGLFVLLITVAVLLVRSRIIVPLSMMQKQMRKKEEVVLQTIPQQVDEVGAITRTYNQLLEDLQKEIANNKELLEQFKVFAGNAIHQIRTPLSVIKIAMEMVEIQNKEAQQQIKASLVSIEHMYDSLSYMVQHEKIEFPPEEINLSKLFKKRIKIFQVVADANDKKFDVEIQSDLLVMMNAMEAEYLIDNNISNAIKFGGQAMPITLSLKKVENDLVLTFLSYGKAIENVETIFHRYVREDESRNGSGIGLNMVDTICDHNRIQIQVDYTNGQNRFSYFIRAM